jgi:hypothetical protein
MGKRPKCWKTLSSFEISTSKTLLGLDKNKTHTFKLMEDMTSEYIDYFGLTPNKLEEEITLLIGGKPAPARIRWSRGNRSNPHFLEKEALPKRDVLLFHWTGKAYEKTQLMMRNVFYEDINFMSINGSLPDRRIQFHHLESNVFLVRIVQ